MWRCKNPDCRKTFHLTGRIFIEKALTQFSPDVKRYSVEKPCCPFCESIEFEFIPDPKEEKKENSESNAS